MEPSGIPEPELAVTSASDCLISPSSPLGFHTNLAGGRGLCTLFKLQQSHVRFSPENLKMCFQVALEGQGATLASEKQRFGILYGP